MRPPGDRDRASLRTLTFRRRARPRACGFEIMQATLYVAVRNKFPFGQLERLVPKEELVPHRDMESGLLCFKLEAR